MGCAWDPLGAICDCLNDNHITPILRETPLNIKQTIAALFTFILLHVGSASAVGTFIPSANRADMVHDAARSMIYITDGGSVLRYQVPSGTFLPPIVLGGQLRGIDI